MNKQKSLNSYEIRYNYSALMQIYFLEKHGDTKIIYFATERTKVLFLCASVF